MFFNTVAGNKESYSKQHITDDEQARELYASIGLPSVKDYKWFIQSNKIKDFKSTVQDIDVAHNTWGKNVPYLKGKNTSNKPIPMAGDLVQVPVELVKLHKDIYLTADLLFVNGILFFLTLIRNI